MHMICDGHVGISAVVLGIFNVVCQSGADPDKEYVRGSDVLDIWFDSGVSWATVLAG